MNHIETTIDAIIDFILDNWQTYIDEVKGDLDLPIIERSNICIGTIDPDRFSSSIRLYVVPRDIVFSYLSSGYDTMAVTIDFFFIVGKYDVDTLYSQTLRYGASFRNMIRANYTAGTTVDEIRVDTMKYFPEVAGDKNKKGIQITTNVIQDIQI